MYGQTPDFIPDLDNEEVRNDDSLAAPGRHVTGVLTFILADMIVFAMLFIAFLIDRRAEPDLFREGALSLSLRLGFLNTSILIGSGVFMVMAVNAARKQNLPGVRRWTCLALLTGSLFGISKLFEYLDKLSHGITLTTNNFYMFYYALTGAHFLHFLGGAGALSILLIRGYQHKGDPSYFKHVEAVGLYWHMVDLLWLFIFPLLYLLTFA